MDISQVVFAKMAREQVFFFFALPKEKENEPKQDGDPQPTRHDDK